MHCKCGKLAHPQFNGSCEDCFANVCGHITDIYKEDEKDLKPENMDRKEILELPISYLKLSTRTGNRLCAIGINYIDNLVGWSEEKLLGVSDFGEASLNEIKKGLKTLGLVLRQESSPI